MQKHPLRNIIEDSKGRASRGNNSPAKTGVGLGWVSRTSIQESALDTRTSLSINTRTLEAGELFVPVVGETFDAHQFIPQAAERGALGSFVRQGFKIPPSLPKDFILIEVDEPLLAYHRVAAAHRNRLTNLKVVAITGSNGKTSTKDFTGAVLAKKFKVLKTEGNLNNHFGFPRMLMEITEDTEIAVLEMGMNHPGELAPLVEMAQPDVSIITNIGITHIEFLGSREGIAREKGTLVTGTKTNGLVVLPASDDFVDLLTSLSTAKVITVGLDRGMIRANSLVQDVNGMKFKILDKAGEEVEASLPVPGRHMVANALLAVAVGLHFGLTLEECAAGLSESKMTKGRLQMKTFSGIRVIDDSYNSNPDTAVAALDILKELPLDQPTGRRIAVLGRMGELGFLAEEGHRRVGKTAALLEIDRLIGVGTEAKWLVETAISNGLSDSHWVATLPEATELVSNFVQPGDMVLVKGSNSVKMENLVSKLETELSNLARN